MMSDVLATNPQFGMTPPLPGERCELCHRRVNRKRTEESPETVTVSFNLPADEAEALKEWVETTWSGGGMSSEASNRRCEPCAFCEGDCDALVVTMTGAWAHLDFVTLSGVRYFNHGAVDHGKATTLWLVPA